MRKIDINGKNYELIKDVRDGFILEEVEPKLTNYFYPFDYIVGDWAYNKLRLKGFYNSKNKNCKNYNNINNLDKYLKEYCAFNCKYFVLKKNV